MEALVVPLAELDRSAVATAGAKAANLGELLHAGFAVPEGFCITTAAYRRVVAAGIAPRLTALLAGLDPEDAGQLAVTGAAIRELFHRAAVPEEVRAAVLAVARQFSGEPVAVRSSATAEDLPEASFAGQQETYLNVVGEAALMDAVRRCWGSLWTDRAIAYRHRNGIPQTSVSLAVVVQRMVPADVAGVLFTANPVSGRRSEVVIEASLGLGEAVVSGLVSPDSYVVAKRGLRIVARRVGPKIVQVVAVPGGGTARVAVEDTTSRSPALADDAITALARLGTAIEEHYGWPQDVEWAFTEGKLYVLQSRPITSLFPAPPPAAEGELHVYLSLNSVQGMLEPFTPMGASVFRTMAQAVAGQGEREHPLLVELGGRLYVEITGLLRNELGRQLPRTVFPEVDPVTGRILQRLLVDPRLSPTDESVRGTARRLLLRYWRTLLPIAARIARFVAFPAAARRHIDVVAVPRLASVRAAIDRPSAPGEELGVVRHFARVGLAELLLPNFLPLVAAGMLCYKQAEALVRRWGLDQHLLARARQGLPYNKTTTMDLALWALAQQLSADAAARAVLAAHDPAQLAAHFRAGTLPAIVQQGMAGFLAQYGHRGVREIDVGVPRWSEDPGYLFGVLQNYLAMHDPEAAPDRHFARQAAAGEQAVADLVAEARRLPGGRWKAAVLGFFLRRYRQLGGLRETPKFYVMWIFQALRAMLLAAGKRLASQGYIECAEDVFFLRLEELAPSREQGRRLRPLVVERRRAYRHELDRHRAPRVLTSEGETFYGEALVPAENVLGGTGASPGVACGRARIIHDPHGARLGPGEILVSPSTDPAWTPLFLTASGLVMEAGGMMSHGAIVAREYGIPAVVGVAEATTRIATGRELEVDGNQGLVRLLQ